MYTVEILVVGCVDGGGFSAFHAVLGRSSESQAEPWMLLLLSLVSGGMRKEAGYRTSWTKIGLYGLE